MQDQHVMTELFDTWVVICPSSTSLFTKVSFQRILGKLLAEEILNSLYLQQQPPQFYKGVDCIYGENEKNTRKEDTNFSFDDQQHYVMH